MTASPPPPVRPGPLIVLRHAHMDLEWLTTYERSRRRVRSVLSAVLEMLERHPRERFTIDGVPPLADALDGALPRPHMAFSSTWHRLLVASQEMGHPRRVRLGGPRTLRRRLRRAVAAGQLEIVGTYTQPDTNLPDGEALVRQGVLARRWFDATLGASPTLAWLMDSFGVSAQMPQILRCCGYTGLLAFRVGPTDDPGTCGAPPDLPPSFRLRGLDGTTLPTHVLLRGYDPGLVRHPRIQAFASAALRFPRAVDRLVDAAGDQPLLVPFGGEFARPLPGLGTALRRIRRRRPDRQVRAGSAAELFDALDADDLPVHDGDLNPVFPGVAALRPEIKRADREATAALLAAETLDALVPGGGRTRRPRSAALARAWGGLLTNHAHDGITGCHAPAVARDVRRRYRAVRRLADRILTDRMEALAGLPPSHASRVGPRPGGAAATRAAVVFNPLPWRRTGLATLPWTGEPPDGLVTPEGRELPCRRRGGALEVAVELDGLSWMVLAPAAAAPAPPRARVAPLAEGATRVTPLDGGRLGLSVLRGRRWVEVATLGPLELRRDRGNAYLERPGETLGILRGDGGWRATCSPVHRGLVLRGPLGPAGEAVLCLAATAGRPWIELDAHGPAAPGTRVVLPVTTARGGPIRHEVPFGEVARTGPVTVRHYLRLDGEAGVANLGAPAADVRGGDADLVLLRAVRLLSQGRPLLRLRVPIDAAPARWRATLALGADARRTGRELNRPLVARALSEIPRSRTASARLMPALDAPATVEITAIKRAEGGDGLVLRLLQMADTDAVAVVHPPAGTGRHAWLVDAMEEPVGRPARRDGGWEVRLGPWSMATLRIT